MLNRIRNWFWFTMWRYLSWMDEQTTKQLKYMGYI